MGNRSSAIFIASALAWPPADAKTLRFAGHSWTVRANGVGAPRDNRWCEDNAFVDAGGRLHLKLTHSIAGWCSAEVISTDRMGFGTYQWQVKGRVDLLDKNVVFGLFGYRIGAQRNRGRRPRRGTSLFLGHQRGHYVDHVGIAIEMVGFEERAIGFMRGVAQMDEIRARREFACHRHQIVAAVRAERPSAQCHPVGRRRHRIEQPSHVLGGRYHAWQAEDRKGRIIGVDAHPHAGFLGHRRDLTQESKQILTQLLGRMSR